MAQHSRLTMADPPWKCSRGLGNGWAGGVAEGREGGTTCKEELRKARLALRSVCTCGSCSTDCLCAEPMRDPGEVDNEISAGRKP